MFRFVCISVLFAVTTVNAQSILLDDFGSNELSPLWFPFDTNVDGDGQPTAWGPGEFKTLDGRLSLSTSGALPPLPGPPDATQFAGLLGTVWTPAFEDSKFSNGTIRATVRAGENSNTDLLLRVNPETGSSYVMTGLSSFGELHFSRIENNVLTRDEVVPGVVFTEGTDWNLEFSSIGNRIDLKAWEVGSEAPSRPQLTLFDDVLVGGALGVSASVSSTNITDPSPVNSLFDDVVFTPAVTAVSPRQFADVEAQGLNPTNQSLRYQQVFPSTDFEHIEGPHLITEIRWRPDGAGGQELNHSFDDFSLSLSTTDRGPGNLSRVFAENIGDDQLEVAGETLLITSNNVRGSGSTKEFDILVPLHTPFEFDPADGNLLLEIIIHDRVYPPAFQDGFATSVSAASMLAVGNANATSGQPTFGGLVTQFTMFPILDAIFGDINADGKCDADDIDELSLAIRQGLTNANYDLNGDGSVNVTDRQHWIESAKNTYIGDANLDGEFNSGDFVQVFAANEYEDNAVGNSTWATGDWNGDADFDSGDFVMAFSTGGYEVGPRVAAVPEPSLFGLIGLALWVTLPILRAHFDRN